MSPGAVVFFDCDSTLAKIEGIDYLGSLHCRKSQLAQLTDQAMRGVMPLSRAYAERMKLVRPGGKELGKLAVEYCSQVVAGAKEAIAGLLGAGHEVFVVTGGFQQAVVPFAKWLGVPEKNVRAISISLDKAGNFVGYDRFSPLLRADGKAEICKKILQNYPGCRGFMVGDATTDARASASGVEFIHFTGVLKRKSAQIEAARMCSISSLKSVVETVEKALASVPRGKSPS